MSLKPVAWPTIDQEPVTLAEAKALARVDLADASQDALLTGFISAAREDCEQILNRTVAAATWEQVLDAFPVCELVLGWPTVTAILSVTYTDVDGQLQTLDPAAYVLDADSLLPGWVLPAVGYSWPATLDTVSAVRVRFTTGWTEGGSVPWAVKSWILMRIATLWKFRELIAAGVSISELPREHGAALLDRWKLFY